jgi:hypothetical protein
MSYTRRRPGLALVALACFVAHSTYYLLTGSASEMLWACNVASLSIAVGCGFGSPWPVASGLLWLLLGTPIWLVYLAAGGELCVTSLGIHLLAPLVGLRALTQLGWPLGSWFRASLLLLALVLLSRLLGEPNTNVNLAFRVWDGWEALFATHHHYLILVGLVHAVAFFGIERLIVWRGWLALGTVESSRAR